MKARDVPYVEPGRANTWHWTGFVACIPHARMARVGLHGPLTTRLLLQRVTYARLAISRSSSGGADDAPATGSQTPGPQRAIGQDPVFRKPCCWVAIGASRLADRVVDGLHVLGFERRCVRALANVRATIVVPAQETPPSRERGQDGLTEQLVVLGHAARPARICGKLPAVCMVSGNLHRAREV